MTWSRRSERPEFAGRAPAVRRRLHCGLEQDFQARYKPTAAPAIRRRAPLRPLGVSRLDDDLQVLPLFTGGLHCGGDNNIRGAKAAAMCSRRSPAGAPLRRQRVLDVPPRYIEVLPPSNGGLHCASTTQVGRHAHPELSAPAVYRQAPLRLVPFTRVRIPVGQCPRRSTAGPIAAFTCERRRSLSRPVLPTFAVGLHCGWNVPGGNPPLLYCAPAVHRRAPLRLLGTQKGRQSRAGAPVAQRRAPLWRYGGDFPVDQSGHLLPLFTRRAPLRRD